MVAQDQATLELDPKVVTRLFREWGWKHDGNNRWSETWKKNNKTLSFTRKKGGVQYDTIKQAAAIDGVTVDRWLDGPPEDFKKESAVSDVDMDWWLNTNFSELIDPEDKIRFRRVRNLLLKEGTLDKWNKVKDKHLSRSDRPVLPDRLPIMGTAPPDNGDVDTPPEPERGMTLDSALALIGRKQNKLNGTACKIITVLAHHGPINEKQGRATSKLMTKMVDPPKSTGAISSLTKEMETAGLIDIDRNGKRTFKIALAQDVAPSSSEVAQYVKNPKQPKPAVSPEPAPVSPVASEPAPQPEQPVTPPVGADMGDAVALLRERLDVFDHKISILQQQRAGLVQAIEVLESGGTNANHDNG